VIRDPPVWAWRIEEMCENNRQSASRENEMKENTDPSKMGPAF